METVVKLTRFQTLLYYLASFIGLAPFALRKKSLHPVGFMRKTYALILFAISSTWIYIAFVNCSTRVIDVQSLNNFVHTMSASLFAGHVSSTLLIVAFESEKIIEIMNRLTATEGELRKVKIGGDDGEESGCCYGKIIATNAVVLVLRLVIDNNLDMDNRSTVFKALFRIGSLMLTIFGHNAIIVFVESINRIGKLFKSLNRKLRGPVRPDCSFFSSYDTRDSPVLEVSETPDVVHRRTARSITASNEYESIHLTVEDVEKLKKNHEELCALVESTTQLFTLPILFVISQHFTKLLSLCYSLYSQMIASHHATPTKETIVPIVLQMAAKTMIVSLECVLIADACSFACRMGNATKIILHKVWNKFDPEELSEEFFRFSTQLMQKRVTVSAFGFFDLGYSYVSKMFCTMVAYFIIIIQLDSSQKNPGT